MKTSQFSQNLPASSQSPEQSPSRILFGNTPEPWAMAMPAEDFEQLCFNISEARQGRFVIPPATEHKLLSILKSFAYYEPLAAGFITHSYTAHRALHGRKIGGVNTQGYRIISLSGFNYKEHHLVWLWCRGQLPQSPLIMDHINQQRDDNNVSNLRVVSHKENSRNMKRAGYNTSGYTGVYWRGDRATWVAKVKITNSYKCIGSFNTAKDAYLARQAFLLTHPELGYTERHGK